jgi:hypothetical protein
MRTVAHARQSFEEKAEWMRDRLAATSSPSLASTAPAFAERHYSLAEIAEMWSLSTDVLRKIFQDEPGVLVLGAQSNSRKRRYTTLRVPTTVLRRVYRRMTNI